MVTEERVSADILMEIEGLDITRGISFAGGTYEKYIKVLEGFHVESLEKIEDIKSCLEAGDLRLFTIYMHAVKNGCLISGAEKLSKTAHSLERAGVKNDEDYINENLPVFMAKFETLLENIHKALSCEEFEDNDLPTDVEIIKQYLGEYESALSELNIKKIRKLTKNLQSINYDAETNDTIIDILFKRLAGDYEEALSLTRYLLDKFS
jgi:HPt (histidine-containing phosphotransfer) domain-containing protein